MNTNLIFVFQHNEIPAEKIYNYFDSFYKQKEPVLIKNEDIINKYKINIHERFTDLVNSGKKEDELTNNDLCKIFEYYSCIKLYEEYSQIFYEYNDIDPSFKEKNEMTKNDTGIDACNLIDTIVQCKLRKETLSWKECGTFFGSNLMRNESGDMVLRWKKFIITRNKECILTKILKEKQSFFTDRPYKRDEIINYCKNIKFEEIPVNISKITLRDYQIECVDLIRQSDKNVVICLPTATGKNLIIIHSLDENKKYLVLVPRIILMEQLKAEIVKYRPELKNKIQLIGDGNVNFDINKNITICVFNSVSLMEKSYDIFDKIFIDEAHHIYKPQIYEIDDEKSESKKSSDIEEKELNYIQIIQNLAEYDNNVYLSATIDEIDDFVYYKKDIREMINKGYLADYTINIPIFSNNPTNEDICKYLLKNYRNIIVYCNTQKEGKIFNELFNSLQKYSSSYIDCKTSTNKRNEIIKKYKEGVIPFLVNVKILVEGFDAPITKGVCFIHLPSSKTTAIQIVGRALRLHPLKTIANIILPFSNDEDGKSISNFMRIIANNDSRIKKSYDDKKLGGYISINSVINDDSESDNDENSEDEEGNNEVELKYDLIYNSMGVLRNNKEIWKIKLEKANEYIKKNKKIPSNHDENQETKILGTWIRYQIQTHKNKKEIMKNQDIYDLWTEFIDEHKKFFMSNNDKWSSKFEKLGAYVKENYELPSRTSKDEETRKLAEWLHDQKEGYKNKDRIMKNEKIYNLWTEFINNYREYFMSNEDTWMFKLEFTKNHTRKNKKLPSSGDKDEKIRAIARWITDQKQAYKNKKYIMKEKKYYDLWSEFINDPDFKRYFMNNKDDWKFKLEQLKICIDRNKGLPSNKSENQEIKKMAGWISDQKHAYKNKRHTMISNDEEIRQLWSEFINDKKYKKYFAQ